jgi:hypothetical protein
VTTEQEYVLPDVESGFVLGATAKYDPKEGYILPTKTIKEDVDIISPERAGQVVGVGTYLSPLGAGVLAGDVYSGAETYTKTEVQTKTEIIEEAGGLLDAKTARSLGYTKEEREEFNEELRDYAEEKQKAQEAEKESGLIQAGTAIGFLGLAGGSRLFRTTRYAPKSPAPPKIIKPDTKIVKGSLQAEESIIYPRTYIFEDTAAKRIGRKVLGEKVDLPAGPNLFPGARNVRFDFRARRVQVSPTITEKRVLEAPITSFMGGKVAKARGGILTSRTLPKTTKFTDFRGYGPRYTDVYEAAVTRIPGEAVPKARRFLKVGKGFDFGLSAQTVKPIKGLKRTMIKPGRANILTGKLDSPKITRTVRSPELLGGRIVTVKGRDVFLRPSGERTLSVVASKRIPFVQIARKGKKKIGVAVPSLEIPIGERGVLIGKRYGQVFAGRGTSGFGLKRGYERGQSAIQIFKRTRPTDKFGSVLIQSGKKPTSRGFSPKQITALQEKMAVSLAPKTLRRTPPKRVSAPGKTLIKPNGTFDSYLSSPRIVGGLGRSVSQYYGKGTYDVVVSPARRLPTVRSNVVDMGGVSFGETPGFQPLGMGVSPRTRTGLSQEFAPRVRESLALSQVSVQEQRTAQFLVPSFRQPQRIFQIQKTGIAEKLGLKSFGVQKTRQLISPPTAPGRVRTSPRFPKSPGRRLTPQGVGRRRRRGRADKKAPYIPEIRRYGKWKPLGKVETLEKALKRGVGAVRRTLGASLRIRRGKEVLSIGKDTRFFRPSKRDTRILVQRRGARLGTRGERIEIIRARGGTKFL